MPLRLRASYVARLASCAALLVACKSPRDHARPAGVVANLRVAVIADLEGVLEPCGCTRDSIGGLDRMARLLSALRAEPGPLLVMAVGDLLYARDAPPAEERARLAQDAIKAEASAALLERFALDVIAPGPRDLESAREPVQALVARRRGSLLGAIQGEPLEGMRSHIARDLGGQRVRILDLSGPTRSGAAALQPDTLTVCVAYGDASTHGAGCSAVVRGGQRRMQSEVAQRAGILELTAAAHGRELLIVELWAKGERDAPFRLVPERPRDARENLARVEVRKLDAQVPSDPDVRRFMAQVFARINRSQLGGDAVKPAAASGATYVGARTCAACHTAAYHWWLSTAHGRAYQSLEKRGRELDLDCIGCHVTGFERPGGARVGNLEQLRGVGCESCHGPGSEHAENPQSPDRGVRRVPDEALCVACHDRGHSDDFHYAERAARLHAPGHGQPLKPAGGGSASP